MKESELSDEFRSRSNCWADTEDAIQAMDEPTAIQFAKDYASDKDAEIEQAYAKGLKDGCSGVAQVMVQNVLINQLRVEITALKDEVEKRVNCIIEINADRAALKADLDKIVAAITPNIYNHLEVLMDNNIALKAENARLRDGIAKEVRILRMLPMQNRTECLADLLSPANQLDASNKQLEELPADDTYGSGKWGMSCNLDRLNECTCSRTIDGRLVRQCENCRCKPFVTTADDTKDHAAFDNAFRTCVEIVLHSSGSLNSMEHRIYALAREWAGRPLSEIDRKMIASLSPADGDGVEG